MTPFAISCILISIISFIAGFVIITRNYKEKLNQFWFLSSLSIGAWSFGLFGVISATNYKSAWFWQNVLDTGGILILIFYFTFILYLLGLEKKYIKLKLLSWVSGLSILTLSFTPLFKKGLVLKSDFNYWVDPGPLYFLFPLFFVSFVVYSFILLNKIYKNTFDATLKMQIKYIVLAQVFGFGGGITNFFPQLFNVYPFGNYLVAVYIVFISYTVFKHHLFNIRVIATELLTFSIWIFVLIRTLLADNLQERLINGGLLVFLIISGILLIRSVMKEVKTREEMEKLAKELAVANARLKVLDQAKSDFVTIASHQLRTPITAIKGYASMILEGSYGVVPEKAKTALDRIFASSNRLVALINDFLNLSRIERGKMEYDFQKVDLKEMVKNVFDEFKTINIKERKGLDLELKISEKESFITTADSDKIRQVIYNLIDNAMKYTQKGFIKVDLSKNMDKKTIQLGIKDSGIGMSKESLIKIFEKFVRGQNGGSVNTEGTGLGLYVAREIAKAHGGDIQAESEGEGKGSTFYLELPYEK